MVDYDSWVKYNTIRLATEEEIENQLIKDKMKKYNL